MAKLNLDVRTLYVLLFIFFVLFILTKSIIIGALVALLLIGAFLAETMQGVKEKGVNNEIKEIVLSILVAAAIWYGACFLLSTSAPLDAVVSCSMLPNLQRGDLVVLQGTNSISAPQINLSEEQWSTLQNLSHFGVCDLCYKFNETTKTPTWTPCLKELILPRVMPPYVFIPAANVSIGNEVPDTGDFTFACGLCLAKYEGVNNACDFNVSTGTGAQNECAMACTTSIDIYGNMIKPNLSNDVIVYAPLASDLFSGDTIHRVYAKILVGDKYYYLTKGDNNAQLDQQWGNQIIPQDRVKGKVILRIPYIGYLKLLLFGDVVTPEGCNIVMQH